MATGTVTRLAAAGESVLLGRAATAYLATLAGPEQAGTRLVYSRVLRRAERQYGADSPLADIGAEAFAAWFTGQWAGALRPRGTAPSTRSGRRPLTGGIGGWTTEDPSCLLRRRRPRPDRSRALSRSEVGQLFAREDISIRERALWRMLYETAARSSEVLGLDVEDLDLPNRRARVRRKRRRHRLDHLADRHGAPATAPGQVREGQRGCAAAAPGRAGPCPAALKRDPAQGIWYSCGSAGSLPSGEGRYLSRGIPGRATGLRTSGRRGVVGGGLLVVRVCPEELLDDRERLVQGGLNVLGPADFRAAVLIGEVVPERQAAVL
jgi:Phage integrase family